LIFNRESFIINATDIFLSTDYGGVFVLSISTSADTKRTFVFAKFMNIVDDYDRVCGVLGSDKKKQH